MKNKEFFKPKKRLFVRIMAFSICLAPSSHVFADESSSSVSMSQVVLQQKEVTGVVKDALGDPLIGVSVMVKGTTEGSITNIDGKFNIKTTAENPILVLSYIGYKTIEVKVGSEQDLSITMQEDAQSLDEVVVVGYGVQKKKLFTGATVQVGGDNLTKLSTSSALTALQSQAPGVNITQSSGMPGEGYRVTVRGLGTVGNAEPLYVIDGVAGGDINALNPSDIESIDVLKDAASAAIYGTRAANGVILVTTKQGKSGKMQVSFDAYVGWQNVYKMPSLLNATEYMSIVNEARFNEGIPLIDFSTQLPTQLYESVMNGTWNGTNWMEEARNKNAITQNYALNLTGGSEQSRYALGFSYSDQEGILGKPATPQHQRYTFRINSDHTLLKTGDIERIKLGENLTYTYTTKSGIGIGDIYGNDIHNMLVGNPLMPVYNSDGAYYDQPSKEADGWLLDSSAANPIAEMQYRRGNNLTTNYRLFGNVYLEVQPIKNLRLRSSFGYKFNASSYRQYTPTYSLSNTLNKSEDSVEQNQTTGHSWTWDNTASYSFQLNEIHAFDAVIGQSLEKWGMGETIRTINGNSQFPGSFDHAWINNTQGVGTGTIINGYPIVEGSLASFFGRVNYNLKETYMATVILRADGSSNFAKGNRWGYFPSVSAGWVMTNEPWMEKTRGWMDFLKLRASWGRNGNCNIAEFQYLSTIALDQKHGYYFGNDKTSLINGAYPDIYANPDVAWETSQQLNIGVDTRFLRGRLGVVLDWYNKKTKDWLVKPPILLTTGASPSYVNGGDIENKGIEIGLNWNDKINDFTYGANFNMSYNKNKVTRIANAEGILRGPANVLSQGTTEMFRAEVGYPIGYFWGYKTAGVFQNQEQINNTAVKFDGATPGDLIYVDTNRDGVLDDSDKTMIGNPNPDVTAGLSFNFGYKGFDLSLTATGAFGHQIAKSYRSFADSPLQNYTTDIFDRWHGEGTSNKLPILTSGSNMNWQRISDIYVENADYVKMQNITLGYDFKRLFTKMPLSQARLYVTAQNLFTITGYSGMDPEVGRYSSDYPWASGVDLGFYPSPRTFLIGFNLKY